MARPKFIAFSPKTRTVGVTAIDAVTCEVVNIAAFPDVGAGEYGYITFMPDQFGLSEDPTDYETATYTGKSANTLTGLTRGVEGTAQEWAASTWCLSSKTKHSDDAIWDAAEGKAATIHNLVDTTNHPVTGLTAGHVLTASGATAYGFAAPTTKTVSNQLVREVV